MDIIICIRTLPGAISRTRHEPLLELIGVRNREPPSIHRDGDFIEGTDLQAGTNSVTMASV